MKILIVFNHPAPYKVCLFNELSKKIDLTVLFERTKERDRPDDYYFIKDYKFNAIFLKKGQFGNDNSYSNEVKKYIKKNHKNFDLIIMNGYKTICEMKAIKYMLKHNIPYIQYINGGVIHKDNFIKRKLKEKYLSRATYFMSPSEEADKYLLHYGANKNKIHHYSYSTIYDKEILQKPLTKQEKIELRKQHNLDNKSNLFICAGQFIERKNNWQLIKLFENRTNDYLLLIGSGQQESEYRNYIELNKINNIKILPFMIKKDLFNFIRCGDCFITLSKEDIYGHTINEAMANGLVTISSNNIVSSQKLIKQGENGFIVDLKEDINKYLDRINELDSNLAIKTAKENTIEKSCEQHIKIFKELLK